MKVQILTYNTHGLPWSRDTSSGIVQWLKTVRPTVICLQEVFVDSVRAYYHDNLVRYGYTVCHPLDRDVAWLGSGLLIAFLESEFTFVSHCFAPYLAHHNVEIMANKGFFAVKLRDLRGRPVCIINTHTVSNTIVSALFGDAVIHKIRRKQFQQIVDYVGNSVFPTLVLGDLNCEHSPHPYVRFLRACDITQKHTFPSTGEDLDHIAWIPLQYADPGCGYCDVDRRGPAFESCSVVPLPWSDHSPLLAVVRIPSLPKDA